MAQKTLEEIFKGIPNKDIGSFSLKETIGNIPSSGARLVGDIFSAITSPIETAKAVGKTALGAVQKLIPGRQKQEESAEQVLDFIKQRYGSKDAFIETIEEDPVGVLADFAGIITGAGIAVRGLGAAGKVSALSKAGRVAQRAGAAIEPLGLAAKGVARVTRLPRKIATSFGAEVLGISTGAKGDVVRAAFSAGARKSETFKQALRGKTSQEDLLTVARDGLHTLKDQRATAYQSRLAKLTKTGELNLKGVQTSIKGKLEKFRIKLGADNSLDFSRSTIADATERTRIAAMVDNVLTWDDLTPGGIDALKRQLDDFYTPSGQGRALMTAVRQDVKTLLVKEVPGYETMVKGYSEATEVIKDIEKALSLTGSKDSAISKLAKVLQSDKDFRVRLVKQLDAITEVDLEGMIAGTSLRAGVPSGLVGRAAFAGALGGAFIVNPSFLFVLAGTSPRVVGEFLNALGFTTQMATQTIGQMKKLGIFSAPARIGLEQAGKLQDDILQAPPSLAEIFLR